jgi:FtsH-binding integral membrane protein
MTQTPPTPGRAPRVLSAIAATLLVVEFVLAIVIRTDPTTGMADAFVAIAVVQVILALTATATNRRGTGGSVLAIFALVFGIFALLGGAVIAAFLGSWSSSTKWGLG